MLIRTARAMQLILMAVLVLGACRDETNTPTGSDEAINATNSLTQATDRRGLDAEFASLSREVPGFAGLYYSKPDVVTVYLTDLRKQDQARPVLQRYMRGRIVGELPRVEFNVVRYGFIDLLTWKERARTLLSDPGVVFLDADEVRNKVTIGVRDAGVTAKVNRLLGDLGIPSDAVRIEPSELPVPAATLRQSIRPTVGGVQITNSTGGICTLGINVLRSGVRGFITNSHCTRIRGGVESTAFAQPSGSTHAVEVLDPIYFTGGVCPSNFRCRYSDAALANYVSSVSSTGKIAETAPGSVTITAMSPVNRELSAWIGVWVQKTGRTTGQTVGRYNRSCVDTGVGGEPTIRMLCQSTAYGTNIAGAGDSGAPVWFKVVDNGVTTLNLSGIFWGFTSTEIFFSDIGRVHNELGAFQVIF